MNHAHNWLSRTMRARPRLLASMLAVLAIGFGLPVDIASHGLTRWLIAWNCGSFLYVLLSGVMMLRSDRENMQQRAAYHDEGQWVLLALVALAAVASLAAIAGELAVVKNMHGSARVLHVALAGSTLVTSWSFIQVMFAQHYAHDYYAALGKKRPPGLDFPGEGDPDYGDFFYFSVVIGTSGQTADVAFLTKHMRRIGSLHCILAYLFNTTVVALLINISASLF